MDEEPRIVLGSGQTAVIGYGSLLSVASLERTLKRAYDGPFVRCRVEGWRRSWDVWMPNRTFYYLDHLDGDRRVHPDKIVYLNVRPVADSQLSVVAFVVDERELKAMHEREWIYTPTDITASLRGVSVEGGPALMYVARPEYVLTHAAGPREAAVRRSYLAIVADGLRDADPAFRSAYEQTTDAVPEHLVVDDKLD
jgi:hypothetical protein